MDFLFGAETPLAVRFFIAFVIVLGLIGGTAYLVRRFGGERLTAAGGRGRQPRLAVVDAAAVDGRRRLILIRRDNVEHLLLIGGPTDVVVEPSILRAAAPARDATPARQPSPAEARAVPLGEGSMWPLQPQAEPAAAPPPAPAPAAISRPQRPPVVEESMHWHAEPEPPTPAPSPAPSPRQTRQADPLAGLAAELARTVPQAEPTTPARRPARQPMREPPRAPTPPPPPPPPRDIRAEPVYDGGTEQELEPAPSTQQGTGQESPFASPADQNLAEMAQRLEAALRRPAKKSEDARIVELGPRVPPTASDPLPAPAPMEPRPPRAEGRPFRSMEVTRVEAPRVEVQRTDTQRTETARSETPHGETPHGETPRGEIKPGQQRSLYDSLEQEMASLLGRPNKT